MLTDVDKWRHNTKRVSVIDVSDVEEDSDETEQTPKVNHSVDWGEEFFAQKDNMSDTSDQDHEILLSNKQTLILTTMVPNELLLMDE